MEPFNTNIATLIVLTAVIITIAFIIIVAFYIGRALERQKSEIKQEEDNKRRVSIKEIAYENNLAANNIKIQKLNELNERYLNFTEHLSDVVKRLYSSLSAKEISSIVISLVKDIINTETIEMYIFDPQAKLLKKVNQYASAKDEKTSYKLGEGLIGSAAQDNIIKMKGVTFSENNLHDYSKDAEKFWIVSPINFNNRLIGVLGIGKVKNPTGNERNLIRIICDIAGVTLANQSYLKEWKHGSMKDSLTGLYNRRYFSHMVMTYLEKSIKEDSPISICLFDIDHFKNYNDMNGHQEGDKLLKEISILLNNLSRKKTVIARYGGEEFIAMLPDISKEGALAYAERVKEEVAGYPFAHKEKQPLGIVSVSGGVASFPEDADTINKVIELADKALYKAKEEGRNRVIKHESSNKLLRIGS
jgi:two-component system cell cycle response regulator